MTDRKIHQATHSPPVAAPAGSQGLATRQPAGRERGLLAVLPCLTAVGPLAIDMYIPGFPAMSRTLHTSSSAIQLTLTAFLAGVVVGQIVIGPVSDSLGRRGLLIGGCAGFAVVALACAFAPGIGTLIVARQGRFERWVDYWDSRQFGVSDWQKEQEPPNQWPTDFRESTVGETASPLMRRAAGLAEALRKSDIEAAMELFSSDAVFEDVPAHIQITSKASIQEYLTKAGAVLPYLGAGTGVRHVLGNDVGGGTNGPRPVARYPGASRVLNSTRGAGSSDSPPYRTGRTPTTPC